jgi:ABC-2 type transport system permease protein
VTSSALTAARPPTVNRGAGLTSSTLSVARRTVRKFIRTPQLIVLGTVQSALFLLIFRYVFGGAVQEASIAGLPYVDFLVPGYVTTAMLFSGMSAAAGVAEDVEHGFFDRLRSLPIPRAAVMAGRSIADTALVGWGLAAAAGIGFAIGFRLHASAAAAAGAFALCLAFAFAFEWMFITMGLAAGNAQAAQGISMLVFPLTFVSSAYIPVATMPGWLRPIAANQPVTIMVNAVRCLTEGPRIEALLQHSAGYYVAGSLIWTAGILMVFSSLAIAQYSRR